MFLKKIILISFSLFSICVLAYENHIYSNSQIKFIILICFFFCYILVVLEEFIHIKKSSITIFFSSIMLFILVLSKKNNLSNTSFILNSFLSSYCELFLFLFVAMIYITTLKSLNFFNFIKNKILLKKLSLRQIYFFTGLLSFFISPFADNLTTSLIMSSIILNINKDDYTFVNLSCINIVIASNAGGTFSPFGDITTLMIWQSGMLKFSLFFKLFVPSLISFIIPSIIMLFFVKNCTIIHINLHHYANLSSDSKIVLILFLLSILFSIFFQSYLNISCVFGMMLGFSFLQIFFFKNRSDISLLDQIVKIEWDTLLFFYGIMLCVVALDLVGVLKDISYFLYYDSNNKTYSNIILGLLSSIIDNIPITFSVLNMKINMSDGQWLLLTYTLATGGSLLSIGSAAGIAVMGKVKQYTFYSHFKWSWAILIGYFCGIISHLIINKNLFI